MAAALETPCTKLCTLDPARAYCLGCGRSVEEIARWAAMDAAERTAIMAELPARGARRAAVVAGTTAR